MMPDPMIELMKLNDVIGMELRGLLSSFASSMTKPRVSDTEDASEMSDIVCGEIDRLFKSAKEISLVTNDFKSTNMAPSNTDSIVLTFFGDCQMKVDTQTITFS